MAWQLIAMAAISAISSAMSKPKEPIVPQPAPMASTERPTVVLGVQDDAEAQLERKQAVEPRTKQSQLGALGNNRLGL